MGLVVDFVLVASALGDFHGDVEDQRIPPDWADSGWNRRSTGTPSSVTHVRRRGESRFTTVAAIAASVTALAAILVALWAGGTFNSLICGGSCGSEAVSTPEIGRAHV